ncbi:MAG TPA: hypothetical protein VKP14_04660 [Gaiellaceae bacterium]|nr:hypothetical protein [Gaiellaceae bacterium]
MAEYAFWINPQHNVHWHLGQRPEVGDVVDFGEGYLDGNGLYRVTGLNMDVLPELRTPGGDYTVEPTTLRDGEVPILGLRSRRQ